jgi:uncharacterized protein
MKKISIKRIMFALFGIFLICVGVAFNASNQLGNDPIGIVYDGARIAFGLTVNQLGLITNGVNYILIALLFFIGRRYVNLGTLIYILPYGIFVNIGTWLYQNIFVFDNLISKTAIGLLACLMIYVGVSIFIAVDIGLDPFTGIVMVIREKLKKDFKIVKIAFDIILVTLGALLGGKIGVITIFTALTAGPSIQWISGKLTLLLQTKRKINTEEYDY